MSTSIQVTSENAGDLLEKASKAQAEADGVQTKSSEESTEEVSEGSEESKEENKDDTPKGLEIEDKAPESDSGPVFTLEELSAEYGEKGALSEETTKKVVDALAPIVGGADAAKQVLDQFIAGQEAAAQAGAQATFNLVGGEENYRQMQTWAATKLSSEDKVAFNKAIGDPDMRAFAIKNLYAQFQASGEAGPAKRVKTGGNTLGGLDPIHNRVQLSQLTGDPRYERDAAFREQVHQRLRASKDAGVYKP